MNAEQRSAPGSSEDELTTILEGIGEGFYAVDRDWRITRFNSQASAHFGIAAGEVLGRVLWDVFPHARATDIGQKFVEVMHTRQAVRSETASVVVAGRHLAYRLFPLGGGLGVVFRDISAFKSSEQHRELLINELNHRVKNTLATVQSIAAQTLRNAGVDPTVMHVLEARLLNLSNVNSVLTDDSWASAELTEAVQAALRPHRSPERENFQVTGPRVRVRRKSAVAISMALHELSTNAIKYGALSCDAGHVSVAWQIADGRFKLRWQEHGGPLVVPPGRKGFGSRLIERGLAAELGGPAIIDYAPTGVICTIDAPYDAIRDAEPAS